MPLFSRHFFVFRPWSTRPSYSQQSNTCAIPSLLPPFSPSKMSPPVVVEFRVPLARENDSMTHPHFRTTPRPTKQCKPEGCKNRSVTDTEALTTLESHRTDSPSRDPRNTLISMVRLSSPQESTKRARDVLRLRNNGFLCTSCWKHTRDSHLTGPDFINNLTAERPWSEFAASRCRRFRRQRSSRYGKSCNRQRAGHGGRYPMARNLR